METIFVFKVSGVIYLIIYDKWQNCVKFEAKSVQNAQFKAEIKEKTDFGIFGPTILSRGGGVGTHRCDRLGSGKFI